MVDAPSPNLSLDVEGGPQARGARTAPVRRRGWFIRVRRCRPRGFAAQIAANEPGNASEGADDTRPEGEHAIPGEHSDAAHHDVAGGSCCCAQAPAESTAPRPQGTQDPPPTLVEPRRRLTFRTPRIARIRSGGRGGTPAAAQRVRALRGRRGCGARRRRSRRRRRRRGGSRRRGGGADPWRQGARVRPRGSGRRARGRGRRRGGCHRRGSGAGPEMGAVGGVGRR